MVHISEDRFRSVVFEALRRDYGGQWLGLTQAVAWVAIDRGMYPAPQDTRIVQINPADEPRLRSTFWQLVAEGVMTLGTDAGNAGWPWMTLTARGRAVVSRDEHASPPDSDAG
ncbi:MAG: hypothetical protein EXR68_03620 [Dehalococcoidia bacterium]|nr:hypothetical protein [Dehalococcoidia bacterium]